MPIFSIPMQGDSWLIKEGIKFEEDPKSRSIMLSMGVLLVFGVDTADKIANGASVKIRAGRESVVKEVDSGDV